MSKKKERKRRKAFVKKHIDKKTIKGWKNVFRLSYEIMDESTASYIKGQYIGSVLLAHAFIEQVINVVFQEEIDEYAREKTEELRRAYKPSFPDKIDIAQRHDYLTIDEAESIKKISKEVRNPYAHDTDRVIDKTLLENDKARKKKAKEAIKYMSKIMDKSEMVLIRYKDVEVK
ncbi:hypothetical protein [Brevibacillus borstelensis]